MSSFSCHGYSWPWHVVSPTAFDGSRDGYRRFEPQHRPSTRVPRVVAFNYPSSHALPSSPPACARQALLVLLKHSPRDFASLSARHFGTSPCFVAGSRNPGTVASRRLVKTQLPRRSSSANRSSSLRCLSLPAGLVFSQMATSTMSVT